NPTAFQVPEEVQVEYVVLSSDALIAQEQVGAEEIKAYYEANVSRYGEPEQRRASHILIAVKSGAGDAEKAKARERAARILLQARKSPERSPGRRRASRRSTIPSCSRPFSPTIRSRTGATPRPSKPLRTRWSRRGWSVTSPPAAARSTK